LRRGLSKKFIGRIDNRIVECREGIGQARFVYVLRPEGETFLEKQLPPNN
jgi:hypothetical protein